MDIACDTLPSVTKPPLQEFADRHGLFDLIETGKRVAAQCFDLDGPVVAQLTADPESGNEWVEIAVSAKGEIPEVREAHRCFTREWLKILPADKALMVRLALTLV
jgi:hypothetical protein